MFPPKVSISFIILLNNGRPGTLADCFSTISAEISIFSRTAYSRNSVSCASILKTCLSSTSVDLRAYKKNFLFSILFFIVIKILFVLSKYYESKLLLISHLLLGEKTLRACAPEILNSLAIPPKNPWSALCAVRLYPPKKPLSSLLVPGVGLEPTPLARHDFESCAYTSSATRAYCFILPQETSSQQDRAKPKQKQNPFKTNLTKSDFMRSKLDFMRSKLDFMRSFFKIITARQ